MDINLTKFYNVITSNKGPQVLAGCNIYAVKHISSDCLYTFRASGCTCSIIEVSNYFDNINNSSCAGILKFITNEPNCYDFTSDTNSQIYPIKWLSYNPISACNYFMLFGSVKSQRGIYSINYDKVCCTSYKSCSCEGWTNCASIGTSAFSTFFSKVADLPSPLSECNHANFCPTPIFRTGKSSWRFSVNDAGTWKEYCSNNMVNWYSRTSFHQQISGGSFSTTGTTILRCCDCFFNVINGATYLDYKVSTNNYERTGVVVSNNDRIYVQNPSGYELAVNVWGYEG
jgi:hypothetical protein